MSKFKVGEKVRIYHGSDIEVGHVTDAIGPAGCIVVKTIYGSLYDVHPKQVRRLKPRERREWWISVHRPGCQYLYSLHSTREEAERTLCSRCNTEAVLVREARSGEGGGK